ncbi:ABC transporter ATP-binding protein [Frigoribacterium sp. CFBP9030]|uniref:ABC transporter ATP-binding protein n=1 Tax=Frigoribacterium sp. CFBP9030 TaxID=3096537 RepID=UPI002A6B483A|nr:ATP-binding cassette domain-containing protein [Frigoribacterium sp. CFBP9030]MDY0890544.1 ATP-binding cassette domain-containing protein [Frigoribacterium sp. CFBP9030]
MAVTTDDEQGDERADDSPRSGDSDDGRTDTTTGTAIQGDDMDGDGIETGRGGDEAVAPTPTVRPGGRAPRRPATPRSAADRSAAAKKAAATRAANARARAAEAAARAAAEELAAREAAAVQAQEDATTVADDDVAGDEAELVAETDETLEADKATDTDQDTVTDEATDTDKATDTVEAVESDETVEASEDDETTAVRADADAVVGTRDEATGPEPVVGTRDEATGSESDVEKVVAVDGTDAQEAPVVDEATRASSEAVEAPVVLSISGLVKRYGATTAVDGIDLEVRAGSFYGIVGPNGAGKTTTLSIVTGLLRPDEGRVSVLGSDVWSDPAAAKRALGVLPDRLRLFDRLTGAQLLYYSATLRGLDGSTARKRTSDLATAFGLQDALGRLVSDYSVGMTKKLAIAAAIIHSPRVLVLDEPFESVDPVSAQTVTDVLQRYVAGGGTVVLSSHSMDLVERICDSVAVIVDGHVLASGTVDEVRAGRSLEQTFVELAGGRAVTEGMEWLQSFSD